jgi:hypothetical protein
LETLETSESQKIGVIMRILSNGMTNAKTKKNSEKYLSAIFYGAPADTSGRNVCPNSTPECRRFCLFKAGMASVYPSVNAARTRKTKLFFENRAQFLELLFKDLSALEKRAKKLNKTPVVRLNGTTDLPWENIKTIFGNNVFQAFPNIRFYDYTASIQRIERFKRCPIPNYHLTFSRKENNHADCIKALKLGFNVSVVMHPDNGPIETLDGFPVINGDDSDLRFLDVGPAWISLTPKGWLKKSDSEFMYRTSREIKRAG